MTRAWPCRRSMREPSSRCRQVSEMKRALVLLAAAACSSPTQKPGDAGNQAGDGGTSGGCFKEGHACLYTEGCCEPLQCIQGQCVACVDKGAACNSIRPCCVGHTCVSGLCEVSCTAPGGTCVSANSC